MTSRKKWTGLSPHQKVTTGVSLWGVNSSAFDAMKAYLGYAVFARALPFNPVGGFLDASINWGMVSERLGK